MIECLCTGITTKGLNEAIAAGATCARDIYKHHGVKPRCPQCVQDFTARVKKDSVTVDVVPPAPPPP